jgi:selenocysteine lyase/cysteine desulfurase
VLNRRELLAGAAAAGTLAACGSSSKKQAAGPAQVHDFAQFYLAAHSAPVQEAIERHRAGLDRGTFAYMADHETELEEDVKTAASEYLGVPAEEIALTGSTTMGLGLLYTGLVRPGDHVLTTEHDFFATHEALDFAGARVSRVRLYDDPAEATVTEMVQRLMAGVTRRTRVVAITWVHSSTGVKLPVQEMALALRGRALLCLDGVHGLAAEPSKLQELRCDAFVAGTHKWLGGPRGTGIMWATEATWGRIEPVIPSFSGDHTPGGFQAFEHRWALAEAFRNPPAVDAALAVQLKERLAEVPGVRVVTPLDPSVSAGLVCVQMEGRTPENAVGALRHEHRVIASVTPYRERFVRFGTLGVSAADVDAAITAVRAL